ncbi:hypothetical protein STAQ_21140 [Allostella sp. ATCC 35155]|nr:hypothetical protein STAQ_21140 [Stella sp. ATCC 35155]
MRCLATLLAGAVLLAGASPAAVRAESVREPRPVQLAAGEAFGAIAYSRATGNYGYSYGKASRPEAERVAVGFCAAQRDRAEDCNVLVWFWNSCAALAKASNGAYGGDHAADRQAAQQAALRICSNYGGGDCRVIQTVCSR